MRTAGIDIGSITAKAAIVDNGKLIGTKVIFTGYNAEARGFEGLSRKFLASAVSTKASMEKIVSTGYGSNSVKFADKSFTEIMCHAAGAHYLNPHIRSIIDIGGQDSKAILVDEKGKVKNFVMNDKCAAGTGRFLEVMARALEVNLDEFGAISIKIEKALQNKFSLHSVRGIGSSIAHCPGRKAAGYHCRHSRIYRRPDFVYGWPHWYERTGNGNRRRGAQYRSRPSPRKKAGYENRSVALCPGQRSDRRGFFSRFIIIN